MVLDLVGRITVVGGAAGVTAALGLGRLAQSMLFEVEGVDPLMWPMRSVLSPSRSVRALFLRGAPPASIR
jgi:hypothetical protein